MRLEWNPPKVTAHTATFAWNSDHAVDVHEGAIDLAGVTSPDRPFTTVTIDQTDVPALFAEHYEGDRGNLDSSIERALAGMAEELGDKFTDTIVNHHWNIKSTGQKQHKDAPNWESIDDSGELADSLTIEVK